MKDQAESQWMNEMEEKPKAEVTPAQLSAFEERMRRRAEEERVEEEKKCLRERRG